MDDPLLVSRGQTRTELAGQLHGLVPGEVADSAKERGEVFPVHVFHREELVSVHLSHVVDAAHARMRDLPRHAHLVEEATEAIGVALEPRRQELQGDRLAELEIVGPVDFSHASPAQEADNPVAPCDRGPRDEPVALFAGSRRCPGRPWAAECLRRCGGSILRAAAVPAISLAVSNLALARGAGGHADLLGSRTGPRRAQCRASSSVRRCVTRRFVRSGSGRPSAYRIASSSVLRSPAVSPLSESTSARLA